MKTYTKSQIQEMLENKEISFSESLILEFKRKEYEDARDSIEAGLLPEKMYGRKFHPLHIEKIVFETIQNNGRLSPALSKKLAEKYNINWASITYVSQLVAKIVWPDIYIGKPKRKDSQWTKPYIAEYIEKYTA